MYLAHATEANQPVKKFEFDLEGLRGFAAILVLWCHAIGMPYFLDPRYNVDGILSYQPPAHFSVLIFFVLSGYVIGISTKKRLVFSTIGTYLKKRLLRIYPIYFVSIAAAVLIASHYPLRTVLGNFTFLQVLLTPVIEENAASWSLQYEILYYLLFIPLSFCAINPLVAAGVCLLTGLGIFHFLPAYPLPAAYALGFTFWCCGWALSRHSAQWPRLQTSYSLLLSALLLFFSLHGLNVLDPLLTKVAMRALGNDLVYPAGVSEYKSGISVHDLTYLPYALLGILLFVHKQFPGRRPILWILYLLPAGSFLLLGKQWQTQLVLPAFSYLLALALFIWPALWAEHLGQLLMKWLIRAGVGSYGLYITHFPLLYCFKQTTYFSGSAITYWVRFGLFILLAFVAAYVLEKKFQPFVKQLFG